MSNTRENPGGKQGQGVDFGDEDGGKVGPCCVAMEA